MAKAETRTVYDGQNYEIGEEIWDLGSLRCVEVHGKQRYYQGHTQDKLKLPKYDDLAIGSSKALQYNIKNTLVDLPDPIAASEPTAPITTP